MKSSTKVFKRSNNCECGKPGIICALDTRGSDDVNDHELVGVFCTECAMRGIRDVPLCSWLHILECRLPQGTRESFCRRHKVYSLNQGANRADAVITDGSNPFLCGLRLTVRLD